MELCKVRYDGSHHLVAPLTNTSKIKTTDLIMKSHEELGLKEDVEKKSFFINEWAEQNFPYKKKGRKRNDENEFKDLDDELKNYYTILKYELNMNEKDMINILYEVVENSEDLDNRYDYENNMKYWLESHVKQFIERQKDNLKGRKGLFRRKALNNEWNYFVTFTYDDKKHNEESFIKTLKKKLQNLHSRYGWLYMGCFERSQADRLHFHGLVYVPQGKMRGNIREESYYDTKAHKKAISYINDEFEDKIGRNDFKPITHHDLTFTNALDYILKYIGKSDDKIIYSRGIKDDYYVLTDFHNNVICKVSETSPYYILGNTAMIELDKNLEAVNLFSEEARK